MSRIYQMTLPSASLHEFLTVANFNNPIVLTC